MEKIKRFLIDEDGMELSEYAVVGGILLLGAVGIISIWGEQMAGIFTKIQGEMTTANGG